ncbi:MAG: hypothetical protein ACI84C_000962 [Flavobacteriales bacterium]|jgi:hypothetical protein
MLKPTVATHLDAVFGAEFPSNSYLYNPNNIIAMKVKISFLAAFILSVFTAHSQGFVNVTNDLGIDVFNSSPTLGFGVSFYDFDNDGWDDLSFCQKSDSLVFFKNIEGTFVQMPSPVYAWADSKHVTWADYDNDGDPDLLVTQYLGLTQLLRNDGNWNFTDVSFDAGIPQEPLAKTFGVSWADYDHDGWLDVYICNYNWNDGMTNWCMHNNGDGTFTDMALQIGIENGSKPSYQSAWIDHNNDQWPDLYVINDFLPQNALYENNGDGTFTDISESSGTNLSIEAMSASANDYDNDGDLDMYISNNTAGNFLMENEGDGTYNNVAPSLGVTVNDLCWGSLWIDYDNDRWDDLYVATSFGSGSYINHFFTNDEGEFTSADELISSQDQAVSFGNAKGDFNNDGFYDIVQANASSQHSFIYENQTTSNNFVKVNLEGTASNRDAIGTWLESYIDGIKYVEYTQLGQNFLGQNSQHLILPLGSSSKLDSLFITWPNGLTEIYYDLLAGTTSDFLEGSTVNIDTSIEGPTGICAGQTTMLSIIGQFITIEWSTGDFGSSLLVDEPGTYFAEVTDINGYVFISSSVEITSFAASPAVANVGENVCFGDTNASINLIFENDDFEELTWSSGQDSTYIDGLSAGWYTYFLIDVNLCSLTDSVEVLDPNEIEYTIQAIPTTCYGFDNGSALIEASGGTGDLSIDVNGIDLDQLSAGNYPGTITDGSFCSIDFEISVPQPDEILVTSEAEPAWGSEGLITIEISGGTEPYSILWNTGDADVEILSDLVVGIYSVWITDANGCSLFTEIEVEQGLSIQERLSPDVSIYPNPAKYNFTVEFDGVDKGVLKMIDAQGKCVRTHSTNGTTIIDIADLAKGIYSITWIGEDGQRFIKQLAIK